jgi:hypothetical protein
LTAPVSLEHPARADGADGVGAEPLAGAVDVAQSACMQLRARCAVAAVDGSYVDDSGLLRRLRSGRRYDSCTAPRGPGRFGATLIPPGTALGEDVEDAFAGPTLASCVLGG